MKVLSPETLAALAGPVVPMASLVLIQFPSVTVALTTANRDITYGGVTYRGAAGIGQVNQIDDSPGEIKGLQFVLSGVTLEYRALALSDAAEVQGAPVQIRTAILANYFAVEADLVWSGRLDTMTIEEDGESCSILVTAESTGVDLLKSAALTNTNADQQFLYPGDRGMEFTVDQADKPVVWGNRAWQIFESRR